MKLTGESHTLIDITLNNNESVVSSTELIPFRLSNRNTMACVTKLIKLNMNIKQSNVEIAEAMILKNYVLTIDVLIFCHHAK